MFGGGARPGWSSAGQEARVLLESSCCWAMAYLSPKTLRVAARMGWNVADIDELLRISDALNCFRYVRYFHINKL